MTEITATAGHDRYGHFVIFRGDFGSLGNEFRSAMPSKEAAEACAAVPALLDLLALALPYVEEAEGDPAYKAGTAARLAAKIRAAIEAATAAAAKGGAA